MARVWLPEKVLASRSKSVIGPFTRLQRHYYLLLSLAGPPASRRWELHLLADRASLLGSDSGVAFAAGPVTLVDHDNVSRLTKEVAIRYGLRIYTPPWGTPLILVIDARRPSPEEVEELRLYGLTRAREALEALAASIEIVEK